MAAGQGRSRGLKAREVIYTLGFVGAIVVASGTAAYLAKGALGFTQIPPGQMGVLSYGGLRSLQAGNFSGEALKAPALFAYALGWTGIQDVHLVELAAALSLAAVPFFGGLLAYFVFRSRLVGGAAALLLSVLPLAYLPLVGGDYALVAAVALVQGAVLFSFVFLRKGHAVLRILSLALASALAFIAGLTLGPAAWLILVSTLCWGAYSIVGRREWKVAPVVLPGLLALFGSLEVPPSGTEAALRAASPLSTLPGYVVFLAVLGAAALLGAGVLVYRKRLEAFPALAFLVVGLSLVLVYGAEAFLLVYPGLVMLGVHPLTEVRGAGRVIEEASASGEGQTVLELHFEKAVAITFALIMLISPFVVGIGSSPTTQGTNYLGDQQAGAILGQVGGLNSSLFGTGAIAAPSSISTWMKAEFGLNTTPALLPTDAALADAITSTSFRLRNGYLSIDDWTPLSSHRTPYVYAFDGTRYSVLYHLDDGANTVTLTSGASEDMHALVLTGHSFSENGTAMTLTLQLSGRDYNVTKQLTLLDASPVVKISYTVVPNQGTPASVTLPIYVDGDQPTSTSASGNSIQLTMPSGTVTFAYSGGSTPAFVKTSVQNYVKSTFDAVSGVVHASVTMDIGTAKDSGNGPSYASLLDAIKSQGITSIITPAPQPGLNYLESATVSTVQALDVKDTFNRVLLDYKGTPYVEAPANAQVLSQNVSASSCTGTVTYQTSGLTIQKTMGASGDSMSLAYHVQPSKTGVSLESMNVTLWIPFDRVLFGYQVGANSVRLNLDSGPVNLTVTHGTLLGATVGPDPTFGQQRVLLRFSLSPQEDTVGVNADFTGKVSCNQVLASRPVMNGSDELQVMVQTGLLQLVYSNSLFAVYQVVSEGYP